MNSSNFKQRTITETLELLCRARGGSLIRAGQVNQSELARQTGVMQANFSRWKNGEATPTDENIRKIAKAFKVTPAQMRGEAPINAIDGYVSRTPEAEDFAAAFSALPEEHKHTIREMIKFYSEKNND